MQSFLRSVAGHPVVRPWAFVVVGCLLPHLLSSRKDSGPSHSMKTSRPKTWRLEMPIWEYPVVVGDRSRRP